MPIFCCYGLESGLAEVPGSWSTFHPLNWKTIETYICSENWLFFMQSNAERRKFLDHNCRTLAYVSNVTSCNMRSFTFSMLKPEDVLQLLLETTFFYSSEPFRHIFSKYVHKRFLENSKYANHTLNSHQSITRYFARKQGCKISGCPSWNLREVSFLWTKAELSRFKCCWGRFRRLLPVLLHKPSGSDSWSKHAFPIQVRLRLFLLLRKNDSCKLPVFSQCFSNITELPTNAILRFWRKT